MQIPKGPVRPASTAGGAATTSGDTLRFVRVCLCVWFGAVHTCPSSHCH